MSHRSLRTLGLFALGIVFAICITFLVRLLPVPSGKASGSKVDEIIKRNFLIVAVAADSRPFSFERDGETIGLAVDLAHEFARRWLGDATKVRILTVPVACRIPAVIGCKENCILECAQEKEEVRRECQAQCETTCQRRCESDGQVDMVATLSDNSKRRERINFSVHYIQDGPRILVPENSSVNSLCDLRGKKVAVVSGATAKVIVERNIRECDFEEDDIIIDDNYATSRTAVGAVAGGWVDAFVADAILLAPYTTDNNFMKLVGLYLGNELYGIGVSKEDPNFKRLIDHTLWEMESDSTYANLYCKWLGNERHPYPIALQIGDADIAPDFLSLVRTETPPLLEPCDIEPCSDVYIIQGYESLGTIASRCYGDFTSWPAIYELNKEVIGDDPNKLRIGMELRLPEKARP